jgi:hypothetical protein
VLIPGHIFRKGHRLGIVIADGNSPEIVALVKALDLDIASLKSIDIIVKAGDPVTFNAEYYMSSHQLNAVTNIIESYHLHRCQAIPETT